jgi:hypothetical protein
MTDDIEGQSKGAQDETIKRSDNGDCCSCCAGASGGCQCPTAQTWGDPVRAANLDMVRHGRAGLAMRAQTSLSISYSHEIRAETDAERLVSCHAFTLLQTSITSITGVAHNGEEPGAAIPAMKTVKEGPGPDIRLLHHIFRIMVIPRQPARHIVRRRQMRQDGFFKPGEGVLFWQPLFSHGLTGGPSWVRLCRLLTKRLIFKLFYSRRYIHLPPRNIRLEKSV